jgi:methylglyoxal synthase
MRRLAIVAHDNKKVDLVAWATYNRGSLARASCSWPPGTPRACFKTQSGWMSNRC